MGQAILWGVTLSLGFTLIVKEKPGIGGGRLAAERRRSVTQGLPHVLPAHLQALPQRPGWLESAFVGQLDDRVPGEMDFVQGLAGGPKIGASLAQRFRPLAVGLLIAKVKEDDLLAVVVDELNRIDAAPDQPVQVGPQLDIRNSLQRPLQIMELILYLVGVIVQVEHNTVIVAELDQRAEQLGLGVELLLGLRPGA